MDGYIYLTINWKTGKKYIGQTNGNEPSYIGSGKVIKRAIKKYGRESFTKEILCSCHNKELLNYWEIYYIDLYNAVDSLEFYNLNRGYSFPEIQNKKLIESSVKARKKVVYEIDSSGVLINTFYSAKEVASLLNVYSSNITTVCKMNAIEGRNWKLKGRIFTYSLDKPNYTKWKSYKKIKAVNDNETILFNSITQAAENFRVTPDTIRINIKNNKPSRKIPYILYYG